MAVSKSTGRRTYTRTTVPETTAARTIKTSGGPALVNFHCRMDKELHRAARHYCVSHDLTLVDLVDAALRKHIGFKG